MRQEAEHPAMSGAAPLAGVVVIEMATFVAGPSAGLALAQLGADVVRVDPLGGAVDLTRWPLDPSGRSLFWTSLNRAKRSVSIDLRSPAGRDLLVGLVTAPGPSRGIFLDNAVGLDWLSWEALSALRHDLIHVHIEGRRDGAAAVDYTVNAASGVPLITGPESATGPVNHVLPAWDLLTGMTAATALLAALHRRHQTGSGARIDIALADVAAAGVANLGWYSEAQRLPSDRARYGNYLYGGFGRDFATADGRHVMVLALTARQWSSLVEVTGAAEQVADLEARHGVELSNDESARFRLREEIAAIVEGWFAARDLATVSGELDAARVLWGPYRTLREAADAGGGPLRDLEQPGVGHVVSADSPIRWNDLPAVTTPAPELGADTYETLLDLTGVTDEEFERLVADGVVQPEADGRG